MMRFPKPSSSEAAIQRAILKYLNTQPHCWATKFPGVLRRGVPDILGVYHGRFIAFEIKRPGHKPTFLQRAVIDRIRWASGRGEVVHSIDEVREILLEIDEERALQRFGE